MNKEPDTPNFGPLLEEITNRWRRTKDMIILCTYCGQRISPESLLTCEACRKTVELVKNQQMSKKELIDGE